MSCPCHPASPTGPARLAARTGRGPARGRPTGRGTAVRDVSGTVQSSGAQSHPARSAPARGLRGCGAGICRARIASRCNAADAAARAAESAARSAEWRVLSAATQTSAHPTTAEISSRTLTDQIVADPFSSRGDLARGSSASGIRAPGVVVAVGLVRRIRSAGRDAWFAGDSRCGGYPYGRQESAEDALISLDLDGHRAVLAPGRGVRPRGRSARRSPAVARRASHGPRRGPLPRPRRRSGSAPRRGARPGPGRIRSRG